MTVVLVTKDNFREIFPEFKQHLRECQFVALDTEFSGLHEALGDLFSYFDTPAVRYQKMKACPVKILQVGIALFKFNGDKNQWHPIVYNFMVFPVVFDSRELQETILFQASALRFLRRYHFDFNKWITDGIPYMNASVANSVTQYLRNRRSILQNGSPLDLETLGHTRKGQVPKVKSELILRDEDISQVVDDLKGFSLVVEAISKSKKVLVGHNVYVDLILMYQEFYDKLPDCYQDFKQKLLNIFPQIIDTKRLAHGMRDVLSKGSEDGVSFNGDLLTDTSLFSLHFYTQLEEKFSPKIVCSGLYSEVFKQARETRIDSIPETPCHDAAFDACVTGCLFIQLAYILQRPTLQFSSLHTTAGELLFGCSRWFNVLNATRCTVPYIDLRGEDPASHRPSHIIIAGHKKGFNISTQIDKLHKDFPKFGDYDLKFEAGTIIVATGNFGSHRRLRAYLSEEDFIIKDSSRIWSRFMQLRSWWTTTIVIMVTGVVMQGLFRRR